MLYYFIYLEENSMFSAAQWRFLKSEKITQENLKTTELHYGKM